MLNLISPAQLVSSVDKLSRTLNKRTAASDEILSEWHNMTDAKRTADANEMLARKRRLNANPNNHAAIDAWMSQTNKD